MGSKAPKRVIIYARISVSREESVSIERQVESAKKLAELRGWEVLDVVCDEGLSATHNKPENRAGWRRVLANPEAYDAVIVWKIDRLARRVIDFLHADEQLQRRGAAVVSVSEPIDMTSAMGRAFATMLAVFAEMEAATIAGRVAAARAHLLHDGRVVGGTVPYGFVSVKNPGGSGFVLAQDPNTVEWVRGMATRALEGASVYSIKQWLDEAGAPLPTASQKTRTTRTWNYGTVERILRSPVLAGMIPYNPGNRSKVRGSDVLRDEHGMPIVDESIAILTVEEHRQLRAILDDRDSPQAQPRAGRNVTSPLLSGLAECGHCGCRMNRGTTSGRPALYCPQCYQTISTTQLVPHLEKRLLAERGEARWYETREKVGDDPQSLARIEGAIRDIQNRIVEDNTDTVALAEQLGALKALRAKTRQAAIHTRRSYRIKERVVRLEWEAATTDAERRAVLMGQIDSLRIVRGNTGRYLDPDRVQLSWKPDIPEEDEGIAQEDLQQMGAPDRLLRPEPEEGMTDDDLDFMQGI